MNPNLGQALVELDLAQKEAKSFNPTMTVTHALAQTDNPSSKQCSFFIS
jgi:hypothetical protein